MQLVNQPWTRTTTGTATPRTEISRETWKTVLIITMAAVIIYASQAHKIARILCPTRVPVASMDIDAMSPEDLMTYLRWIDPRPCRIKQDFGGSLNHFPHIVNSMDGQKQMCLDPGLRPRDNCTVYSFGIEKGDWSFEESVQSFGCHIFVFEATKKQPNWDRTPQIHFYNLGISHEEGNVGQTNGLGVRTLKSIYEMLVPQHGRVPIDYVKMDIDSSEWLVMPEIVKSGILENVKQLAVELHFHDGEPGVTLMRSRLAIIKDLEMHGMVRFASRPNYNKKGPVMGLKRHTVHELVWFNAKFRQ